MTKHSTDTPRRKSDAPFARPLAFTTLLIYGLMTFIIGFQDYREVHRLPTWVGVAMILAGVLIGSTAIRVLMRRYRAFSRALVGLATLVIVNCFSTLIPGLHLGWREITARVVLSVVILYLVWRSDRALIPPDCQNADDPAEPPTS
ncbi:MAG: hypothetical protein GY835_13245 [bacterium]|nr:hypothetical protein [bacterium]